MYLRSLFFVNILNIALFFINCSKAELSQEFVIKIIDYDTRINVTMKKVDNSYLANEYLQVWTMNENKLLPYDELKVMSKIGTIASYFNYEQKAAFIYSSNYDCLNGVIGIKYIIKNLPMHLKNNDHIIGVSEYILRRKLKSKKPLKLNRTIRPRTKEELIMNEKAVNKTLYPEILIVVKNDFYSNWKPADISNGAMILYIISLINAADMLYSTADILKVKLNIAGIIIESKKNLLPPTTDYSDREYLSVESLVHGIINSNYTYFEKSKLNPYMSYDWIFFLTSKQLSYSSRFNFTRMSSYPKKGIVKSRQEGCGSSNVPISIITDDYNFISYPRIGHETFHLIIQGSYQEVEHGTCHFRFLDVYDVPYLEPFQWSDDCCLLTNKPQSLNYPSPTMSPMTQCQCYGFKQNYFINPTKCTEMLTCEDEKKNEQTVPSILDDAFCRDQWNRKRVELMKSLDFATSTTSTTTTTVIPPLTIENDCSWINENILSNMMFIFPQENEENNDDGLVCLATMMEGDNPDQRKIAFTAKSCVQNQIKLRNYLIQKEDESTTAESQSDADFSVTVESFDDFDSDTALLSAVDDISDNFMKLSGLKSSRVIRRSRNKECRIIHAIKVSNNVKPFIIKYIPIDISIQGDDSTSNYIIKSKDPVDKSELSGLKGNPLFCKISGRAELVGILVDSDDDKHLRFVNVADYKEVIQNKIH